jgi:murein DD-endopeptidase MepM/ murein hydrolase activator NlpD
VLTWALVLLVVPHDVPLLPPPPPPSPTATLTRIPCGEKSLREAFIAAGQGDELLAELDDATATRFDLYALPRTADCALVVAALSGHLVGAAVPHHGKPFMLLRWAGAFYDADGYAMQGPMFARPLPIAVVTSRWGDRFHPVTGERKTHQGVDYGAVEGTPVWAVADGTVITVGSDPVAGKNLRILHAGDVVSRYLHLQGFAPHLATQATVTKGQVVGYVGKTGRVTGPHLHFELIKWGRVTDPLEEERPSADRLSEFQRSSFNSDTAQLRAALLKEST